ncbi:uncharacterized protein LOC143299744 [Babylonia areolata]|uniref:uncharacterized protein LOC143299744 n=1 Tax=Babylonia areolata TaxID=304850 RepID=UPI003FD03281
MTHSPLCFVLLLVAASFFRERSSECIDSGLMVDDRPVYFPKPCGSCKVKSASGASTNGFKCDIGNQKHSHPDACRDIHATLVSTAWGNNNPPDYHQVSHQATLVNLSTFSVSCEEMPDIDPEVSLAFTAGLPACGKSSMGPKDALMVEFNARNDSNHNYYATHPICRAFIVGGNSLRHFPPNDSIQISYDCIGVGLEDERSPEMHYFLAFTTFPTGAVVNYTVVFLSDASRGSMQLVAAAWLSTRRIHVIFVPVQTATDYVVEAKGEQFNHSDVVSSSSPSVVVRNIPPETSVVTVAVRPRCGSGPCSPIQVTLHDKTQLTRLPVERWPGVSSVHPGDKNVVVVMMVMVVSGLALGILVIAVMVRKRWVTHRDGKLSAENTDSSADSASVTTSPGIRTSVLTECLIRKTKTEKSAQEQGSACSRPLVQQDAAITADCENLVCSAGSEEGRGKNQEGGARAPSIDIQDSFVFVNHINGQSRFVNVARASSSGQDRRDADSGLPEGQPCSPGFPPFSSSSNDTGPPLSHRLTGRTEAERYTSASPGDTVSRSVCDETHLKPFAPQLSSNNGMGQTLSHGNPEATFSTALSPSDHVDWNGLHQTSVKCLGPQPPSNNNYRMGQSLSDGSTEAKFTTTSSPGDCVDRIVSSETDVKSLAASQPSNNNNTGQTPQLTSTLSPQLTSTLSPQVTSSTEAKCYAMSSLGDGSVSAQHGVGNTVNGNPVGQSVGDDVDQTITLHCGSETGHHHDTRRHSKDSNTEVKALVGHSTPNMLPQSLPVERRGDTQVRGHREQFSGGDSVYAPAHLDYQSDACQVSWPEDTRLVPAAADSVPSDLQGHCDIFSLSAEGSSIQADHQHLPRHVTEENGSNGRRNPRQHGDRLEQQAADRAATGQLCFAKGPPGTWSDRMLQSEQERRCELTGRDGGSAVVPASQRHSHSDEDPWIPRETRHNAAFDRVLEFTENLFSYGHGTNGNDGNPLHQQMYLHNGYINPRAPVNGNIYHQEGVPPLVNAHDSCAFLVNCPANMQQQQNGVPPRPSEQLGQQAPGERVVRRGDPVENYDSVDSNHAG